MVDRRAWGGCIHPMFYTVDSTSLSMYPLLYILTSYLGKIGPQRRFLVTDQYRKLLRVCREHRETNPCSGLRLGPYGLYS